MRAYSLELRARIVRAVQTGHPKAEVAELFGVDRRTINRYLRLAAAGELTPKSIPGRPSFSEAWGSRRTARQLRRTQ